MPRLKIFLFICLVISASFVSIPGFSGEPKDKDKALADINRYTLTVADYDSEAQGKLPSGLSDADFEIAKENLLEDIITKKVLLQEAQKQSFDKDKAFIKEIERYWEQALLKLLYNKKSQELLRAISADEKSPEIRDRLVREAMDKWIEDLKRAADIKKYRENLKAVRPQHKE
jgi:hypothetical protein